MSKPPGRRSGSVNRFGVGLIEFFRLLGPSEIKLFYESPVCAALRKLYIIKEVLIFQHIAWTTWKINDVVFY